MGVLNFILAIALLFVFTNGVFSQFDVPFRYDGFSVEGPTTRKPVMLEVFLDPLCPTCRSTWPVIRELMNVYSSDELQVVLHPFPTPYHRNSMYAAWGMHITAHFNRSLVVPFLEIVYANQSAFSDISTFEEEPQMTIKRFAAIAPLIGLDADAFHEGYTIDFLKTATVTSFKYGCSRNVVMTPTHLVNGVLASGSEVWTVADWMNLIGPFLNTTNQLQSFAFTA